MCRKYLKKSRRIKFEESKDTINVEEGISSELSTDEDNTLERGTGIVLVCFHLLLIDRFIMYCT